MQLKVTPRVEGALKIVGVRWKLSGSVVGFYNFQSEMPNKKTTKGRRKAKQSPFDNLSFLVIKVHAILLEHTFFLLPNHFTNIFPSVK